MKKIIRFVFVFAVILCGAIQFSVLAKAEGIAIPVSDHGSSRSDQEQKTKGKAHDFIVHAENGEQQIKIYPDIWFLSGGNHEILYPPENDTHFLLPNGLHDMLIARLKADKNHKQLIAEEFETFFGRKRFKVKSFDRNTFEMTLLDGEKIRLSNIPSWWKNQVSLHNRTYVTDNRLKKNVHVFPFPDGSFAGLETLAYPSGNPESVVPQFPCEPAMRGVVYVDSAGKVIWRRTIVALAPRDPKKDKHDSCLILPQQRILLDASDLALLPDGSVLVDLSTVIVRIDAKTGSSPHLPENVRIVPTEDFVAYKDALYTRLQDRDHWDKFIPGPYAPSKVDPIYSLMLQYFFFPELLASQ